MNSTEEHVGWELDDEDRAADEAYSARVMEELRQDEGYAAWLEEEARRLENERVVESLTGDEYDRWLAAQLGSCGLPF